ncbi:MAG: methyl-accepting chemotaxis protein [Spirochaetales bacterium]|nr:methyl-accepting chemotaxis protein [Spirochaetales bacterium]
MELRSYFDDFAVWSNIDMVMNEDITQEVIKLKNAIDVYKTESTEKNLILVGNSVKAVHDGIETWNEMVKEYPDLVRIVKSSQDNTTTFESIIANYSSSVTQLQEIKKKWDDIIAQTIIMLEEVMEETIDPAKANAAYSGNISLLTRWSNIDMIMNEAVITNVLKLQTAAHDFSENPTAENLNVFTASANDAKAGIREWQKIITGVENLEKAAASITDSFNNFTNLGNEYNTELSSLNGLAAELESLNITILEELETAMEEVIDPAKAAKQQAALDTQTRAVMFSIIFILACIGLGIALAILITKGITKAIKTALNTANRLSEGDLTVDITVDREDETGMLLLSMKEMVRRLKDVISNIIAASDNVSSGSEQMSSTAQQLSQGATEQAASAEEVSSSIEEMGANIRQNADNSLQTEKIALKAANDTQEGGKAVEETVAAMKEIAEKISIIEEIARQTNLLALNAAIEAARAGEHGKGFAVVASEVRKLAERSQKAAGEISELSKSSVDVAEQAGGLLTKIVPDIQKTAELVQEISAASGEQKSGTEQINKAIMQLDTVIQQNASASEEMASMAEELSSQAEQLQTTVSFFKTNGNGNKGLISGITRKHVNTAQDHKVRIGHIEDKDQTHKGTTTAVLDKPKNKKKGVELDMPDEKKGDEIDSEFEKF